MCGIAGIVRPDGARPVEEIALRRMARAVRHRGPDGFGLALGQSAGFVSTRLAIFDIQHGWQPMQSDAGGTLIVYNGEVFNHPELRAELARDGINLETTSDTEVVHRLLERDGLAALDKLNGQFAFAWWEPGPRRLTLVRDRFGIHPLHWTLLDDGTIVFGSEAKALFASGEVSAEPDLGGIDDVFTTWAPRAPRSAFRGVNMLPPGELIVWEGGKIVAQRTWWKPDYTPRTEEAGDLEPIMRSSVELRLRADVPVGTYLSGGLDSSLTTALAKRGLRPSAAHVLGRVQGPALRRARASARGRREARDRSPRRGRRPGGDRRRLPRRRVARRDPAHPHRPGAAVPARQGDAGAGHHGRGDGRGRGRAVLGLRPLQGGRRAQRGHGEIPTTRWRSSPSSTRTSRPPAPPAGPPGRSSSSRPARPTIRCSRTRRAWRRRPASRRSTPPTSPSSPPRRIAWRACATRCRRSSPGGARWRRRRTSR